MTTVLQTGVIPQDCHNAHVLSIPKTDAPTNILETRPSALTECALKLLTKIITTRISAVEVWQEHDTITQRQYASLPVIGVYTPLQITRCIFEEAADYGAWHTGEKTCTSLSRSLCRLQQSV